jgi:heptosyltransferase-1
MTKILIIKTSSMGDIIHTLPAVSDAVRHFPTISFDWVIEPAFSEIPLWHKNVKEVIPVPLRRFRKEPLQMLKNGEVKAFVQHLRRQHYDMVLDAQGLMKSALMTCLSKGLRCGLDWRSAWEPLASLTYHKKVSVSPTQHAITRMRELFSKTLGYALETSLPDYGLTNVPALPYQRSRPSILMIHGTTWVTKEWPEEYWRILAKIAAENGFDVLLPWGSLNEQARAQRIAFELEHVSVLPKTSLTELAGLLLAAKGVVSVDTGLGHLAAALNIPTVSLYGPTDPKEIGTLGQNQAHLTVNFECAPCVKQKCYYPLYSEVKPACFTTISPERVWKQWMQVAGL